MKLLLPVIFISLLSISLTSQAESIISVDSMNYPVWIKRDQSIIPLAPGDQLNQGDTVQTGNSGRVWLSMADGSVVKLGQDAEFEISVAEYEQQNDQTILNAALDVVKGAFRFTTAFFGPKRKTPHQVNIKIGAITAGLRGTDIWGRSNDVEDFVTLLEGSIDVSAEGEANTLLSTPLSLYLKKRHQLADPVTTIDMPTVEKLGQETELSDASGIATINGDFELILMSLKDPELVEQILTRFHQAGYAVDTSIVDVDGESFTRLLLKGFVNSESATNLSHKLESDFNLQSVWVKKRSF